MSPWEEVIPSPFFMRIRLGVSKQINPRYRHSLSDKMALLVNFFHHCRTIKKTISQPPLEAVTDPKAGDLVQVRTANEIATTLSSGRKLEGCTFVEEMISYCGTIQKILKPVTRIMDEREHQLKKVTGVVLLENVICQGTKRFGPCDLSCFYLWRIEWLKKVEG